MRFGVLLPAGRTATPARMLARAEEAEAAGLESVWTIEDYDSWEAFASLGYIAARTRRVRLGISVTVPYVRNTAMLAAACATLDQFSEGRLMVGLGRSLPTMLAQAGIAQRAPLAVLRDTISALRMLWTGKRTTFRGAQVDLHEVEMEVTPAQSHLPIILGTSGPSGLELAGQLADGVVFSSFAGVELVRRAVDCLRQAARAASRSASDLVVSRFTPIAITDDPRGFLQSLRPLVARDLSIPGRGEQMLAGTRWSPEILAPIRAALHTRAHLERGIEPYRMALRSPDLPAAVEHVPLDLVQEFAMAGSLSACRDRLAEFADAGVDRFIISSSCALSELRDLIRPEVS